MLKSWVRAALREPLIHFLLAGLALFAFFSLRNEAVDPASRAITISEDQVKRLAAGWAQTWQRQPTPDEVDGLIRDHLKEEIYYREGLRLGFDQDDLIIRRRIRAKMEFFASARLDEEIPDDAVLQTLLDKNPARYATDARFSFDQIPVIAQDEGAGKARAQAILAQLIAGADWHKLGDRLSLPHSLERETRGDVIRRFGSAFATTLSGIPLGGWSGPIQSGYGLHLVRVRAVASAAKPAFADVRQALENDWRAATFKEREAKAYQALLDGYTIKIAKP